MDSNISDLVNNAVMPGSYSKDFKASIDKNKSSKNGENYPGTLDKKTFQIINIERFPHLTDKNRVKGTIENLKHLLDAYGVEVVYDVMLKEQSIAFKKHSVQGHDDLIANANISRIRSMMAYHSIPTNAFEFMSSIFAENSKNPIIEFIESKPWDKRDRIKALANAISVKRGEEHYLYLALRTWLIQCVAAADSAKRTKNKGAVLKFELVLVFQGPQGAGKTSFIRSLLPPEFSKYIVDGCHLDPADKESVRIAISGWITELGELDSTFKRDVSRLKAFLSKQTDTMRLPYDRAASQFARRTSFCASVNPEAFLVDSTGSRRFLPVQVIK